MDVRLQQREERRLGDLFCHGLLRAEQDYEAKIGRQINMLQDYHVTRWRGIQYQIRDRVYAGTGIRPPPLDGYRY